MKPGPVVNDVIDGPKPPPGPPPAPTQPNKLSPVRIALFAGVGVIGLLIVIAGVVQMSGGPKQDEEYSNNDDYIPPTPSPPPSPPPPPAEPDYASFGGYWTDDFQNTLQVQVSSGGTVVGQAISGPLYGYSLAGQFNGSNFAFQIGNAYGVAGGSTGKYDGGCHIRYTTTDAYGNATGSAQLHINHQPGAPCP
jgi:hypothetical protein